MAFTGLYSSWLQVGNVPALTGTPYGLTGAAYRYRRIAPAPLIGNPASGTP